MTTDEEGRVRWTFPTPGTVAPVVTALPADPDTAADRPLFVVLEEVDAAHVVVRVWRARPRRGQGVADPVGAGVAVHLTATPCSA